MAKSGAEPTIKVVIADDHAMVREGLRSLIEGQPGLTVVGEASDGAEVAQRAKELHPDVIVLDLSMPRVGGAEAADILSRESPNVKVLALTMHEERSYVSRLLRAGAAGYVLKRTVSSELVRAIRQVASGGTYVDPSLAGALLTEQSHRERRGPRTGDHDGIDILTARETEVLKLVARGYSNKEIAAELEISVKTVETHKANGMAKLELPGRAALIRFALERGWLGKSSE